MNENFWGRIDNGARKTVPMLTALFLVLVSYAPTHLPGYSTITPLFGLMVIYHWTLHRPDLLPSAGVFGLGLLADAMSGVSFGVNALVFLSVYGVVLSQRRFFYKKGFPVIWAAFVPITAVAALLYWLLVMVMAGRLIDPTPLAFQVAFTGTLYPLAYYGLAVVQKGLIDRG